MLRRIVTARQKALAASIGTALILTACATATPYQPIGGSKTSGGYSSQRIENNRFRVMFSGNQFTSRQRVENYLLYRAAELTVQEGFDGFTLADRATDRRVTTTVHSYPFYDGPYGWWGPSWRYHGPWGWRGWDPWYGDPFFSSTVDVDTIDRYEASAEIVMFKGARPNDPKSFDAREVMRNLGPTIELPK
ncbi:MAG TPA: hypothetical protein VI381_01380 [Allosphingosinicella sp.]